VQDRLTALDASFLHVETPNAHMHVAWAGLLRPHATRPRPTLPALRAAIDARLAFLPRFRQRLASDPLGVGDPRWVDSSGFDVRRHVTTLGPGSGEISLAGFTELCDDALSRPLPRSRPLWRIYFAARVEGDRIGVLCKLHHAMVDGKSAVEVATLLFEADADAPLPEPRVWRPRPEPGPARLTLDALSDAGREPLRAARGLARLATSPVAGGNRIGDTLRRTALALGDDLLRPAPASFLNEEIGPARALRRARLERRQVERVRKHSGATVNDVCLAVVAGALRELALARHRPLPPLKAMVPVSVRSDAEAQSLGNRISFAFVDLPVDVHSPLRRLRVVQEQTAGFKRSGRPAGTQALVGALGVLPAGLRKLAAHAMASERAYNLVVSSIPGPPVPLYMLGARLEEAYPVVPLSERHALSIGIFGYLDRVFLGVYADPVALPDVDALPTALAISFRTLERAVSHGPAKRPAANLEPWRATSQRPNSRPPSSSAHGRSRSSSTSGPRGADPAVS
jgi:diacylglycerol O-acyltransferase